MTAATALAHASRHGTPEPGWAYDEFERLSEDEVVLVLLRRMHALLARGFEPGEALIGASRVDVPIF